jgi:hypothetical protein
VLSSYRTISNDALIVNLDVGSTANIRVDGFSASYVRPDGRQVSASNMVGPLELAANATAAISIVFPPADPGGRMVLELYDKDGQAVYSLEIPVPGATTCRVRTTFGASLNGTSATFSAGRRRSVMGHLW